MIGNKKGVLGTRIAIYLIGLITALVLLFIFVGGLIFSSTLRIIVSGVLIGVITLFFAQKLDDTKSKQAFGFIGVSILVLSVAFALIPQSVLGISTVTLAQQGDFFVGQVNVNNIDEGFSFRAVPDSGTGDLRVKLSKADSYCTYTTEKQTKTKVSLFGITRYEYYILSNPERTVNVRVESSEGTDQILDGTVSGSQVAILDDDGRGLATVESQGILAGKRDCPEASNVVVVVGNGNYFYYDANAYFSAIDGGTINALLNSDNLVNSQFTQDFEELPVFDFNQVKGNIEIGSGVFTVTASKEFFETVEFEAGGLADPVVKDILIPEMKEGDTSTMKVIIDNKGNDGTIIMELYSEPSDAFTIQPSTVSDILKGTETYSFTIKAGESKGVKKVRVNVCGASQFGIANCDTEYKSFNIVSSTTQIDTFCGDGACQTNEAETTCPVDCAISNVIEEPVDFPTDPSLSLKECSWYQEPYTKLEKDYGALYWRAIVPFVDPLTVSVSGCRTSGWFQAMIIGGSLIFVGITSVFILRKPKKKKKK